MKKLGIVLLTIGLLLAAGSCNSSTTPEPPPPTTQYTLSVTISPSNGGSVTRSPNQSQYASGTVVTLTATPASGYTFTRWEGGVTGTANPTTITMNGNKTVTAVFTASTQYTLTVTCSPSNGGSVTRSPNQSTYAYGTLVTLTATPSSGYTFTRWEGSLIGTVNPGTVFMDSNKTITAVFTQGPTSITAYATYDNTVLYQSLIPAAANTVYATGSFAVGYDYYWSMWGGYDLQIAAAAIYFNVQSQIQGRNIASATLRIYAYILRGEFSFTPRIRVRAFASNWSPSTLTYNIYTGMQVYNSGIWYAYAPSTSVVPVEFDVTTIVRNWASGSFNNYGFDLSGVDHYYPGSTSLQTTNFQSLETYYSSNQRPQLYIVFQ